MAALPGEHRSLWLATAPGDGYPGLAPDLRVDVAVVGAGIAGISTALLLKLRGFSVALLDANGLVEGVTGHTTAKVTAQHRLIYARLRKAFGADAAELYAQANQAGLAHVRTWVETFGIDCDLETRAAYVYTERADEIELLAEEVRAATAAGLRVQLVDDTPLPFAVAAAYRLDDQAQFHPRKYLLALARRVPGDGCYVFEHTRVHDVVEDEPWCVVHTDRGDLRARDVVLATHMPLGRRGLFFAKVAPYMSYALAARIAPERAPAGLFITAGEPTRSLRTAPDGHGGLLLVVGGEGHKVGDDVDSDRGYLRLAEWAQARFDLAGFEYRWATHDLVSADGLPYIGRIDRDARHLFVATGFGKWGMTTGTFAAQILCDHLSGKANPWAELFDATRHDVVHSARRFLRENGAVVSHYVGDRMHLPTRPALDDLEPGEATVLRLDGEPVAAHRPDDGGPVRAFSAVCPHLGCIVHWNPGEATWDCPCHGSRFDGADGHVLAGPAQQGLEPRLVPAAGRARRPVVRGLRHRRPPWVG